MASSSFTFLSISLPLLFIFIFSIPFVHSEDLHNDLCPGMDKPSSCPINCFRADPVCGVDGVTYWCGCPDALCAGTRVAKIGYCEVGNGGSGPISGQAFLLVHMVWLIVLGFSLLFGFF